MNIKEFSYHLPVSRIAQEPIKPRDHCKLMVLNLAQDSRIKHMRFFDLPTFLHKGDVLVFNDSKVIPARIFATKPTGGKIEMLLIKKMGSNVWRALVKNVPKDNKGKILTMKENPRIVARLKQKNPDETWTLVFNLKGAALDAFITTHGITPTPPYIKKIARLQDYQTIYAREAGSVAAPTAGLHFTKRLLAALKKKSIEMHTVTLHVGLGTFLPIRTDRIEEHTMHPEYASVSQATARAITKAKKQGRRIIAVGTTTVRVLESLATKDGTLRKAKHDVNIFIYPGYQFKIIDGLITNFHLPHSTLLVLVSAFAETKRKDGIKQILKAYRVAVKEKYRFFSFGDAMFIV